MNKERSPIFSKSVGGARHQTSNGTHANLRNDRALSDLEVGLNLAAHTFTSLGEVATLLERERRPYPYLGRVARGGGGDTSQPKAAAQV